MTCSEVPLTVPVMRAAFLSHSMAHHPLLVRLLFEKKTAITLEKSMQSSDPLTHHLHTLLTLIVTKTTRHSLAQPSLFVQRKNERSVLDANIAMNAHNDGNSVRSIGETIVGETIPRKAIGFVPRATMSTLPGEQNATVVVSQRKAMSKNTKHRSGMTIVPTIVESVHVKKIMDETTGNALPVTT